MPSLLRIDGIHVLGKSEKHPLAERINQLDLGDKLYGEEHSDAPSSVADGFS
jgi:hypothetical protein